MIDLTPLEVRKKKGDFRRAMRGYDPALVDDFLDLVADRLEELVRENLTLQERVTRQDEQVKDHRDRERALTEALVSAQEMREEVRRQAVREAELSKSAAEQHAAQLRAQVEEEVRQLRSSAREEAQKLLGSLQSERQREEETLRHLRARQQEFFNSYRAFLEEELAELAVIARAGASRPVTQAGEKAAAQRPAKPPRTASPRAERPRDRAAALPAREDMDAERLDEGSVSEEAAYVIGATPAEVAAIVELSEPFEPEAFLDDESAAVGEALAAEQEAASDAAEAVDRTELSGPGAELRLYDAIAPDQDGDGVPGPIGLGAPAGSGWESEPQWSMPDLQVVGEATAADEPDLDDDDFDDDDDADTVLLLRNAAAAGYILPDDDLPVDELLLDDAVIDEDTAAPDNPEDDGWLPTLLEDDK